MLFSGSSVDGESGSDVTDDVVATDDQYDGNYSLYLYIYLIC